MSISRIDVPKTVEQNGAPHYGNTEDETLRKSQVVNDLDKDYEEDSEDQSGSHTTKGNIKRIKDKETKKKRKRDADDNKIKKKIRTFFLDKAEVGDDTEEEEEFDEGEEEILGEDELEAIARVDHRHEAARRRLNEDSKILAEEYENRYKSQIRMETSFQRATDGSVGIYSQNSVSQQSLIPSVHDPAIFSVKCKPGDERTLVRSILMKQLHIKSNLGGIRIKSVFHTTSKGYIYIEALAEPLAKEAVQGLRGFFPLSFKKVPVNQMTSLLSVQVEKKALKVGQFVRIRRGLLKGDLAKILLIYEGGNKAIIQAVPRPDYLKEGKFRSNNVRPPQVLFSIEEAAAAECEVNRRRMPLLNETMHYWENDFYRNGFLIKDVYLTSYVTSENVKPSVEEIQMFREIIVGRESEFEDFNAKSDIFNADSSFDSVIDTHASEEYEKMSVILGDIVLVVGGELKGLTGKVIDVDEINGLVRVAPMHSEIIHDVFVEANLLIKQIKPGAHVKITAGSHLGQTGKVVCISAVDGSHIAAILTDGVNTEISVNVSHLQVTNEVTMGLSSLSGYELYDLVILNQNETAVIVFVGPENLTVVNHQGIKKQVQPMELRGKKTSQSQRTSAFDASHNIVACGDIIKVTDGPFRNKSGTIKHILKSVLWVHSTSHLKDSGIFVVRSRSCVLSGSKSQSLQLVSNILPAFASAKLSTHENSNRQSISRYVKDSNIGKTAVILKGAYKGYLAQVLVATESHYQVEVFAKTKKIYIEKEKISMANDVVGSLTTDSHRRQQSATVFSQATPYMQGATPTHGSATTPMHSGSETPKIGTPRGNNTPHGASTPGAEEAYDPWKMSSLHGKGGVPDSRIVVARSLHSAYYDGNTTWNTNDKFLESCGSGVNNHDSVSVQVTKKSLTGLDINHNEWRKNTVIKILSEGTLGVLQSKIGKDGIVDVRRMEGGRLTNDFKKYHYESIAPATPYTECFVEVMTGKYKGMEGRVTSITGCDVFIGESRNLFRLQHLLWKFVDSK